MKFFFSKNENGEEIAEEIVMVRETLDVPTVKTEQHEIASVIALALRLYKDSKQEEENTILMLQKLMKMNSPWSCKAYGLRQQPMYMPNQKRK